MSLFKSNMNSLKSACQRQLNVTMLFWCGVGGANVFLMSRFVFLFLQESFYAWYSSKHICIAIPFPAIATQLHCNPMPWHWNPIALQSHKRHTHDFKNTCQNGCSIRCSYIIGVLIFAFYLFYTAWSSASKQINSDWLSKTSHIFFDNWTTVSNAI